MDSDIVPYEKVPIEPIRCLRESKAAIGEQYWLFVGVTTIGWLIASAVPLNILLGPMVCGVFLCFHDRLNGKQAKFDTLFKGFDYFVDTLLATLIWVVSIMVAVVPVTIIMLVAIFTTTHHDRDSAMQVLAITLGGSAIIMLVSILSSALFLFVYPLILFNRMKPMAAVKTSARAALSNLPGVLGLVLLLNIIMVAATMCCYFPAFLFAPIAAGSVLMAYRRVFPEGFVVEASVAGKDIPQKPGPEEKGNPFAD